MNVTSIPINATLRAVNMQDEHVQSLHRMRPDISRSQMESVLTAISTVRGSSIGNGFLTITNELREA